MKGRYCMTSLCALAAACLLSLLAITNAAQKHQSSPVEGYPELTRNYSRFLGSSVVFTEGSPVEIRRKKSGIVPATLKVVSTHQGADSNPKALGISIVGARSVEAGDIDVSASGRHSQVIINNRIRTQYENKVFAGKTRAVEDESSLTGTRLVADYHFLVTPAQLAQFAEASSIEIATTDGVIVIGAEACRTAKPLLKWYTENTPSLQTRARTSAKRTQQKTPRRRQ